MTTAGPYQGVTTSAQAMDRAFASGVVRLAPAWVPRAFCTPGRRLKLHPNDYFPLAKDRGGIDERWLASAVRAENGPLTDPYEGLSLAVDPDGGVVPFDEFIEHFGARAIGDLWESHRAWPMYSKFFDNQAPLPFHIHHRHEHAQLVGKEPKPEAYYYPPQMNDHFGEVGVTYFGLHPEVTREQVKDKLAAFLRGGDNRITELSKAYRITLGTGWDVPAGVLHAPASVCTYEPQAASDVFAMCESWSNHREVGDELLWKDIPTEHHGDLDFVVDLIDWELNTDPNFWSSRFTPPVETSASQSAHDDGDPGYREKWVTYRSEAFSAKELTVAPGASVSVDDQDAYGFIVVAGRGEITTTGGDTQPLESPTLIRYGQLTYDEYFVTAEAARAGVTVKNTSPSEELVILKHFGPTSAEWTRDQHLFS
ncbi:hypothetical protein [Nesterenkonia alba]|uniref:hypothetical protein n=1 Tax=Nesterenkonia alba TaxID=515814 RepID=UPI0003B30C71|nr:hypothetical protein [Nesterenkonia alba]